VNTRLATLDDATSIAILYVHTRRIAYAPFYPADVLTAMSIEAEAENWRLRIPDEEFETLLAVDDADRICGFVHFGHPEALDSATGEIEFLYVGTEHQGGGLGKQLIELGEAGLAVRGLTDAFLWVYERNAPARAFYERRGWAPDGSVRESGSAPGLYLLRYRKVPRQEDLG
jgi:ribosomal protein S18 acetylase RimI-like enzyme